MSDLLIHSMSEFSDLILTALRIAEARTLVEIGAEHGGMSRVLAEHAAGHGGTLTSIDPTPDPAFVAWAAGEPHVCHLGRPSLEAIDSVTGADAWLVDGDHNWFTVFHELEAIERNSRRAGTPLLVFIHDIGWPWGRRDLYYAPDRIPVPFRHPYSYDAGVDMNISMLVPGGGFRGMGAFAIAMHEGGPRNGVLTAVDDFLTDRLAAGREYGFAEIPAVFGLGVLFALDAAWSGRLASLLLPFHQNPLLARLERNRLRNYLKVIELQGRAAASRRGSIAC